VTGLAVFGGIALFGVVMVMVCGAWISYHQGRLARLQTLDTEHARRSAEMSELQLSVLPKVRVFFMVWTALAIVAAIVQAIV
jgi:hypothetical protein